MYPKLIKPILDFIAALMALLLLSPVFLMVWILLTLANQGKPFFIQPRPGKNGKVFNIIKFKTMNDRKDIYGNLLPDADRLTPVGTFVRKTSLDELPQLLNVLKGDMSLVGPRPLLTHYVHLYNDFQNRRHEVKPGITGWAQVNGRNAISWDKKFELDVWYVDNISFSLDFKIFLKTLLKVIKSDGISQSGQATMEYFTGNNKNEI
jgi:undecaprenyl phosphate N,N'-diacetylbacillosamine 1-phosphate transferase